VESNPPNENAGENKRMGRDSNYLAIPQEIMQIQFSVVQKRRARILKARSALTYRKISSGYLRPALL
jgi:hypothetical protein